MKSLTSCLKKINNINKNKTFSSILKNSLFLNSKRNFANTTDMVKNKYKNKNKKIITLTYIKKITITITI
jgi:hypothetical protein